jgi:hypothetical protein
MTEKVNLWSSDILGFAAWQRVRVKNVLGKQLISSNQLSSPNALYN